MKRSIALALAAATATSMVATAAVAVPNDQANDNANDKAFSAPNGKAKGKAKAPGQSVEVQVLQFSDFHGHLQPIDRVVNRQVVGTYGGAAYLAGLINELTAGFKGETLTVSSGDSIGGSAFYSGLFQDESTIEILNAMGLDASAVGNHEFDEGVDELFRMVEGGNHPELGQFGDVPYAGTDFPYLAANVVWEGTDDPILPPYTIQKVRGVKVGFIGVVTDDTPFLVSPGGIADVEFVDEAVAMNRYAAELQAQGVQAIVGLVHEGGKDGGAYSNVITAEDVNAGCGTLSGPVLDINAETSSAVDVLLTGHTHNGFACELTDPSGQPRAVVGPGDWGRVLSQTTFQVDRGTKDVVRDSVSATNHVVDTATVTPDAEVAAIVAKWVALGDVLGQQVVGQTSEPITGDASTTDRDVETEMGNLVADSILWGTKDNGAQIAFMNIGGVRASLDQGDVTYREAYNVLPFNNLLVTITMTGAQIEAVLEQQYVATRSRPTLALGVSDGFTYDWDGVTKSVTNMQLDGVAIDPLASYRVSTLSFLQEGGDGFTAFTAGTELTGGPEDLANFVAYLQDQSPVSAPEDRVSGL
jgi:5'-nucleotidase